MRRSTLLALAMVLTLISCRSASAQYSGNQKDPLEEIESARSKSKSRVSRPASPSRNWARSNSVDQFGRVDMAGHAAAHYPMVRGDIGTTRTFAGKPYGTARRRARR